MGSVLGKRQKSRAHSAANVVEPAAETSVIKPALKPHAVTDVSHVDSSSVTSADVVHPLGQTRATKTAKMILKSVISASTQDLLATGTTAEDLLTGNKTSQAFLNYIRFTEAGVSKQSSVIENALVFWMTVRDLDFVPDGMFRSFVIAGAYESYIQPHAKREIPIFSGIERAQLKILLDEVQMDKATVLLQQFSMDALELVRNSFANFLSDRGPYGFRETRIVKGTLPANHPHEAQAEQRELLEDLLEQPSSCRAFREYFTRIGGCPDFMFLVDVLDYKDTVQALHNETMTPEKQALHVGYTMRKLRKIYNKYLKAGSKAMINLQERQREALLMQMSKNDIPAAEVFDTALNNCSYVVIVEHLHPFLQSPEYAASKNRKTEPEIHGQQDYFSPVNGLPTIPIPTLPVMVSGSGAKFFRSYLREEGVEPTMDFFLEIEQFKLLPHNKKSYIATIAGKIFKKYICRGAKLEVFLPAHIRRHILQDIADPRDDTFNEASEYILGLWERKYIKPFRNTKWFNEMHLHYTKEQNSLDSSDSAGKRVTLSDPAELISQNAFRDMLGKESSTQMTQFHRFLVKESCASYLLFYTEIEEFKRLPKSDYLTRQAKKIYYRFLEPSAKESVSMATATISEITTHMDNPSPAMFKTAQDEVLVFLWKVLYPKFVKSPFYCDIGSVTATNGNGGNNGNRSDKSYKESTGRSPVRPSMAKKGTVAPSMLSKRSGTAENLHALAQAPPDVTIQLILANHDTRSMFLAFCEEIYCAESLYFWLECNEYKSIPHVDYLRVRAQKIYRKYIADTAKLQVNLIHSIVRDIDKNLAAPSRTLFVKAQEAIVFMMGKDTFPKFKASKNFDPCVRVLAEAHMSPS
ncbi:Aste57867_13149 [Aphanomyces stellatus]|uniref:Aste57867_13149 protein n=1 Tax=Aphanomyces stellatus TaxID=120398 RepID=A0A485KXD0_9STRA|nr:hypothetical protein As57867_013100 [Aphanomyces stellatus]VFT89990.1 Aste57867_13149 [Aphanomyces stellatus]